MELFDKRFVYFMWDEELKGKKVFVADSMGDLIFAVENDGKCAVKTNALRYSGNNVRPFHAYVLGANCSYPFAYYDPNYEAKRAFNEGKKIQVYDTIADDWVDLDEPLWCMSDKYRVKPESLGYARVETKGSDCDKQEGYTLAVSKCHWENYIDYALPKENILDKPDCPCEEGIDSKACVGCEHSEDGKPHPFENYHCYGCDKSSKKNYRPFKDCDELVEFWSKNYQTGFRPANTKPLIWVRLKVDKRERLIVAFGTDFVEIGNKAKAVTLQKLFDDYEFLDGCVIGVKNE